jgi:hypothetical protein
MQKLHEICTVDQCGREHHARGFCKTHYTQWKRGVPVLPIKARDRSPPAHCTYDGCTEPVKANKLCSTHYMRLLRHGHTRYRDRKRTPKPCAIPGCENWCYAKGVCHAHYMASRNMPKKYGITLETYVEMMEAQNGLCLICGRPERAKDGKSGKLKALAIDHCHGTLKVRGLLCSHCNRAIGLLDHSSAILAAAADYCSTTTRPEENGRVDTALGNGLGE